MTSRIMGRWFSVHTHSHFSTLDGMTDVPGIVAKASQLGYPALGLTDHGNMAGTVRLYKSAKEHGIKPFPGVEMYLIDPTFDGKLEDSGKAKRFHLGLLALDLTGYQALVRFVSQTYTRPRFNRFPRASLADLAALGEEAGQHIALTTGCFFGIVQQTIIHEGEKQAAKIVKMLSTWFPHTFIEVQNHSIFHEEDPDAPVLNDDMMVDILYAMSNKLGLPIIATQDSHYTDQGEKRAHALMKRMVYGGVEDEFPGDSFHLASEEWVASHYDRTVWEDILEGCDHLLSLHDLKIPPLDTFKPHVPKILDGDEDADEILWKKCTRFLKRYLKKKCWQDRAPEYKARLVKEFEVIRDLGMSEFFLFMLQCIEWGRRQGFAMEARGSANGSLVCFLLMITQVDPIIWGGLFERFLSRDRIKPPDIDMDIEDEARPKMLAYIDKQFETMQIGNWCLAPESRVLCADLRWRPIKELNVGDEIIGFDEQVNGYTAGLQSCYRTATVTANDKVRLPSYRVTTDIGEVTASSNHMWVVTRAVHNTSRREWVRTEDLQPGDTILSVGEPWEQEQSFEAGWLSGMMDGEGHIGHDGRVTVGQVCGPVADRYERLMTERGFEVTIAIRSREGSLGSKKLQTMRTGGGVHESMRLLGTLRPERLMRKADRLWEGRRTYGKVKMPVATVTEVEFVGRRTLYAIGTSTKTLIAEGMFSHNSELGARADDDRGSVVASYIQYLRRKCIEEAWAQEQRRAEAKGKKPVKGEAEKWGRINFAKKYGHVQTLEDIRKVNPHDWVGLKRMAAMKSVRKSYGVHASGVLVSGGDMSILDWVPSMLVASSNTKVSQYDMDDVEEFGFLKADWLGQRTLRVMRRCQELILSTEMGRKSAPELAALEDATDFSWIPEDDPAACKILREGRTDNGIFHFEGYTKAKGGKEMGIKSTKDCVFATALFMPGAMESGQKDLYISRRKSAAARKQITYLHPIFEKALHETYGAVIFQEQPLTVLREMGMSIESINKMFKVVKDSGKGAVERNKERLAQLRKEFDQHAKQVGMWDVRDEAWHLVTGFMNYGFNRAHSSGYGIRSYRCAYLKAHYPLEFMSALLECWAGDKKEKVYAHEARRIGIRLMPPDVNVSGAKWTMDRNRVAIRRGLTSVAGIGLAAAEELAGNAPYESVDDLAKRCNPKRVTGCKAWIDEGKLIGTLRKLDDVGALESLK